VCYNVAKDGKLSIMDLANAISEKLEAQAELKKDCTVIIRRGFLMASACGKAFLLLNIIQHPAHGLLRPG
jgi:hypothetical protein